MTLSLSTPLRAALLLGAAAFITPSHADVIYESATAGTTPNGGVVVQGDGTTDGSNILGGVFTLSQLTRTSDIGGNFLVSGNSSGGGNIFGELVQVSAGATVPDQSIELLVPI